MAALKQFQHSIDEARYCSEKNPGHRYHMREKEAEAKRQTLNYARELVSNLSVEEELQLWTDEDYEGFEHEIYRKLTEKYLQQVENEENIDESEIIFLLNNTQEKSTEGKLLSLKFQRYMREK